MDNSEKEICYRYVNYIFIDKNFLVNRWRSNKLEKITLAKLMDGSEKIVIPLQKSQSDI